MGEMADWINDDMQEAFPEWCPIGPRRAHSPAPITCRICGKKNLHWETTANGYRLFTKKNELHVCYPLTEYRRKYG